jgi:hypothetical protein
MTDTILEVDNIHTYYGNIHALKGVSLKVRKGEIVTLINLEPVLFILKVKIWPTTALTNWSTKASPWFPKDGASFPS